MKDDATPTLAHWMGGEAALRSLTDRFYAKVPDDPVLAPIFAAMDPHHAELVARFICEVFGGGAAYTGGGGSHAGMIGRHVGRHLTEEQRKRWVALMLETADEVGVPDDPEFRAALVGYFEWGTQLAVLNSREDVVKLDPLAPMPVWDWSPAGGPWNPT